MYMNKNDKPAEILEAWLLKRGAKNISHERGDVGYWTANTGESDVEGRTIGRIYYRGEGPHGAAGRLRAVSDLLTRLSVPWKERVNDAGYTYLVVTITPDLWKNHPPLAPQGGEAEQATA